MDGLFNVYCHTNKANGKRYIGITKSKVEHRWSNGSGYKDNPHFYSAIQKYGWDGFEHSVLFSGLSEERAKELERELIAEYNLQDRRYGYNMTAGGDGLLNPTDDVRQKMSDAARSDHRMSLLAEARKKAAVARTGCRHSAETIKKMSDVKIGHQVSEESRRKISESKKGRPSWNKGIPFSDDVKRRMSEAAKNRKQKSIKSC